jgi:ribosomal protein S18 acetylase RimI-like enzyme
LADQLLGVWHPSPSHLLLAWAGNRLVGTVFGKARRDDPQMGQISMLAVHPDWQRQGVGGQLLDTVLASLLSDGCVRCRMYVAAADEKVQQFYESRGWVFTGQLEPSPETGEPERVYVRDPLR